MEKLQKTIRQLSVNTDLPQSQLSDNVFTKAINFRPENNSLVSVQKSAIAPSGGSAPWAPLPTVEAISLPEILRLDFTGNFLNAAASPDPNIFWRLNTWAGTPSFVEGPTVEDLAVTNCVFVIAPSIYVNQSIPPLGISMFVTLMSTIVNNLLLENTSAGPILAIGPEGHLYYQGVDTGQAVATNSYFTVLFQFSSVTNKTTLFFKNGLTYVNLGENTADPIITGNIEANSPWGRDMTTERVASIVAYRGFVV